MSYNYHYDLATSQRKVILKLIFKWKGSIWKAIYQDLLIWCFSYAVISCIYRFALDRSQQDTFERLMQFCNRRLDYIPINFMLGFFVTTVINRWMTQFANLGMIDNIALFTSMYLNGKDERGRMLRRSIVRYCVMSQTMVFRDIHIGVRKRFPTLETMVAAGIMTKTDLEKFNDVESRYAKYWLGFNWCVHLLNEARREGRLESAYTQNAIAEEIKTFRSGLSLIWTYDWVPLPLMYPQLVFLAVHCYYLVCLVSRQFVINSDAAMTTEIDLGIPFMTIIEFIFYMGWLKVAMDLLNPFGEDEDDFDCNFLIDRNLTVAMGIVDDVYDDHPDLEKDMFWNDTVSPLYSKEAAQRNVNFYFGSATNADDDKARRIPDDRREITMVPHPFNEKMDQMYGLKPSRTPFESVVEVKRDQRFSTGTRKTTSESRARSSKFFQKRHSRSLSAYPREKPRSSTDVENPYTNGTPKICYNNPECILEDENEDCPHTSKEVSNSQRNNQKHVQISNKRASVISLGRSKSFNHFGEHVDYHDYYDFDNSNDVWFSAESLESIKDTVAEALYQTMKPGTIPSLFVYLFDCVFTGLTFFVSSYVKLDFTTTFLGIVYFPGCIMKVVYIIQCFSAATLVQTISDTITQLFNMTMILSCLAYNIMCTFVAKYRKNVPLSLARSVFLPISLFCAFLVITPKLILDTTVDRFFQFATQFFGSAFLIFQISTNVYMLVFRKVDKIAEQAELAKADPETASNDVVVNANTRMIWANVFSFLLIITAIPQIVDYYVPLTSDWSEYHFMILALAQLNSLILSVLVFLILPTYRSAAFSCFSGYEKVLVAMEKNKVHQFGEKLHGKPAEPSVESATQPVPIEVPQQQAHHVIFHHHQPMFHPGGEVKIFMTPIIQHQVPLC